MREFFGLEVKNGGYLREPEGYFSWQHLLFVTLICLTAILLGVLLGKRSRSRSYREKNRVLITAALLFDALEVFEIVFLCFRSHDPLNWVKNLPLFLCSVQAIALPMAAFCKGRLKLAALDLCPSSACWECCSAPTAQDRTMPAIRSFLSTMCSPA